MECLFIGGSLDGQKKRVSRRAAVKWAPSGISRDVGLVETFLPKRPVADGRDFIVDRHDSLTAADEIGALINNDSPAPANLDCK